jgi:ribose transport system substrate-binding protein
MLRALEDAKRAGKVRFVGFDSSEKLVEALSRGELNGLAIQNPFAMGERGVSALASVWEGKPVDKRVDTGVVVATPENMKEPAIAALLSPDIEQWLK